MLRAVESIANSLEVIQNYTLSRSFLLVFYCNYVTVLYHF